MFAARITLFLLLPLILLSEAWGEESLPLHPTEPRWFDTYHDRFSRKLIDYSATLDGYLTDDRVEPHRNHSWVRLTLGTLWEDRAMLRLTRQIQAYLDFPKLKRRLYLEIHATAQESSDLATSPKSSPPAATASSSTPLTTTAAATRTTPITGALVLAPPQSDPEEPLLNTPEPAPQQFTVGVGFWNNLTQHLTARLRGGVKIDALEIDLFASTRLQFTYPVERWQLTLTHQLKHSHHNGDESLSEMSWERPLSRSTTFRALSYHRWIFGLDTDQIGERLLWSRRLEGGHRFVTLLTGIDAAPLEDQIILSSYFVQLGYHQRFFRPWLLGEVLPRVDFERPSHFTPNYSILFQLVANFGTLEW